MLDLFIYPILGLISVGFAVVTLVVLFALSEHMKTMANPLFVLPVAIAVGFGVFALLRRLTMSYLRNSRAGEAYDIPVEQAAEEIRALMQDNVPGLPIASNWEELKSSRESEPDRDGFQTLSFVCYFQDYDRSQRHSVMRQFTLQQDVVLEPEGERTKVELIFHFREDMTASSLMLLNFKRENTLIIRCANLLAHGDHLRFLIS